MENIETSYENLKVGGLYVYNHRDERSKEIIMLYKNPLLDIRRIDEEIIAYVPKHTPFMILEKYSFGHNHSYSVMWTDENTETVMGWIRNADIISEDYMFFTGCEMNTMDIMELDLKQCKFQYQRQLAIWQATVCES